MSLLKCVQAVANCSYVPNYLIPPCVFVVSKRGARYRPYHQTPIKSKEELAIPLPAEDPRRFLPMKAATNDSVPSHLQHPLLIKLINKMMKGGNKELSSSIVLQALENIKVIQVKKWLKAKTPEEKEEIDRNPLNILQRAIENCRPKLNLIPHTRGGTTYMIPTYINEKDSYFRSIKWIILTARDKDGEMRIYDSLTRVLMDSYRGEGRAVQKKQEHHRQCETNRAYAHYKKA